MNADLSFMPKGEAASAKWQGLSPFIQQVSSLEFMLIILDGKQRWKLEEYKSQELSDGRQMEMARISMRIGEFAFAFYPFKQDLVLIDFHLELREVRAILRSFSSIN